MEPPGRRGGAGEEVFSTYMAKADLGAAAVVLMKNRKTEP